jgi:hypothetical protein
LRGLRGASGGGATVAGSTAAGTGAAGTGAAGTLAAGTGAAAPLAATAVFVTGLVVRRSPASGFTFVFAATVVDDSSRFVVRFVSLRFGASPAFIVPPFDGAALVASRCNQLLTVVCGTPWRRAASTTPTSSTAARIVARSFAVYCRRFRGSSASFIFVLAETSTHPQIVRSFRPRSPWTMLGNSSTDGRELTQSYLDLCAERERQVR